MATLEELKAKIAENKNRFTLVAKETSQIDGGDGLTVTGVVHGTIAPMDGAYVIFPAGQMAITVLSRVETVNGDTYTEVQSATDEMVRLSFPGIKYNPANTPKFSIVTNIEPQRMPKPDVPVENPQLLAIARAVEEMKAEPEFMPVTAFNLVHSNFMAVAKMDRPPVKNAKGQMVMQKDAKLSFLLIPDATDPENPEKKVMPLFTDMRELAKWKGILEGNKGHTAIAIPFTKVYETVVNANVTAIVINPFAVKQNLYLNRGMLDGIVNSEGYQREFVRKEKPAKPAANATQTKQVSGKIMVPGDSPEVRKIRDTLSDYGIEHSEIAELHLLLRVAEDGSKAYQIMVDTDGDINQAATEINAAVSGYCEEVTTVEFVGKDQIERLTPTANLDSLAHRRV